MKSDAVMKADGKPKSVETTRLNSMNKKQYFYQIFITRAERTLILPDSTYRKVQASDRKSCTTLHSYPSAKGKDLSTVVYQYNNYHKIENLIVIT